MHVFPFLTAVVPDHQERDVEVSSLQSTIPSGALMAGLSVYKNMTRPLTIQGGAYVYPTITKGARYSERITPAVSRGDLFYVTDSQAYTVDEWRGELVRLTFAQGRVATKAFIVDKEAISDMALDVLGRVIISSIDAQHENITSSVWRLEGSEFKKLFTMEGALKKFTLGKRSLYGLLYTKNGDAREKWVVSADFVDDGSVVVPVARMQIDEGSGPETDTIVRDADENLYVGWQNTAVLAYRSDLKPMYVAKSNTDVRHLAVQQGAKPVLYIAGFCTCSETACIDELNLDEESQQKQVTLYDVDYGIYRGGYEEITDVEISDDENINSSGFLKNP